MNGGEIIARIIANHNVPYLFTLCGGHISPIFVAAKNLGIKVIDTRHEANAVFAADAVARITGITGVAAVTAGPGVTNTITAIKNAQMAQTPIVLLGGAAATILKGRGSLQDIDQLSIMKSITKWSVSVKKVKDFAAILNEAFRKANNGVPGPVFVECPIDLLYDEELVRNWYTNGSKHNLSLKEKTLQWYMNRHVNSIFQGIDHVDLSKINTDFQKEKYTETQTASVVSAIKTADKPLLVIGSGSLIDARKAVKLAEAVNKMGIPVFLSGMARGLLGKDNRIQFRHNRKTALKKADLIILAGVPCDFRLDYGRHLSSKAKYIGINKNKEDLYKNKKPNMAIVTNPASFLIELSTKFNTNKNINSWFNELKESDDSREKSIAEQSAAESSKKGINPIALLRLLDTLTEKDATFIADGGDFIATASYTLKIGKPLSWLDPGVYGTLGVGGGFAIGAKLCKPTNEVWIIYGDGSSAFSIAEIDTLVRHNLPVIILIGNDASWAQIARDQIELLNDDVATVLNYSNYEKIGEAFGAAGKTVKNLEEFKNAVIEAKKSIKDGIPYIINAFLEKSDFRKGSISM